MRTAFIALLLLSAAPASGHSWYTGLISPVTGASCCGGYDCKPIAEDRVTLTQGGYSVLLDDGVTEAFVPFSDTLYVAPDEHYHLCPFPTGSHAGSPRCFIAPPSGF